MDKTEERVAQELKSQRKKIVELEKRTQAESRLDEREERYRRLLESATGYVYTVDIEDGRPIATSHGPVCVMVTGYTAEEYSADPDLWHRMVHVEDQAAVTEQAARALVGEAVQPLEHRIVHKNGSIRWVRNIQIPRFDEQGRLVAYDGLITDITERKLAEEAHLREMEAEARARAAEAAKLDLELEIAERKRAEEILLEYQRFTQRIVDAIPTPIFYKDAQGIYLGCNVAFEKYVGLTREEIVGKSVHDLIPQKLADLHHEADMTLFRQPGVQIYEALDQSADGTRHAVIFNKATFLNSDGAPGGLVGAILDITERKRAEEALNRRAVQLALINDIGRKIAAALDLNEVLSRAARLVQKNFGYHHVALFTLDNTQGELLMKARAGVFAHLFPLDHRIKLGQGIVGWVGLQGKRLLANDVRVEPHYINFYPAAMPTLSELCVPIRVGDENVGVLDVQSPQVDAFDENDVIVMETLADQIAVAIENARLYDAVQRELTERKRIEEALRRHNEELMAINTIATTISQSLDLDHILNATLDAVLVVMEADAGWVQLLDQDKKGGPLLLAAHRGLAQEVITRTKAVRFYESIADQIARSGQPIVMEQAVDALSPNMDASRQEEPYAFVAVPIKSKDQVLGVLGFYCHRSCTPSAQDLWLLTTIGHQIGVAVENVWLAEKASEIEVLRELDHLRSELIANTSHELRTPLGLIKVFCTTLLRQDVDFDRATLQEFLGDIKEETDKLEEIVDNLLDLSRMQNKRLRLDKRPTDAGQLARKVLGVMEIQFAQHQLVYDFPPEPLVAMVDPKCIEQVLRNLLSNAVKYSPNGGTITVQGRKDEGRLLIQVSDQGIGIPEEDLDKVFERFYRVENEITQNIRGVGLGLPVCRGIVEAHGGRIWAESTLGVGSVFSFTLPIGDGSESHPDGS